MNLPKVRKAQLITGFGPGAIISDVNGQNMLILARRHWRPDPRLNREVIDAFLRSKLRVRKLVTIDRPPPFSWSSNLTAIRVPQWHYCSYCHQMIKLDHLQEVLPSCSNRNCRASSYRKSSLVPVRLLAVCKNGHLSDFPFSEHVHGSQGQEGHILEYRTDPRRSGLSGVIITCLTCTKKKTLDGVLSSDGLSKHGISCRGESPWMLTNNHEIKHEHCEESIQAVQKSSSNVYFPIQVSSIYVPPQSEGYDSSIISFFEGGGGEQLKKLIPMMSSSQDFNLNDDVIWNMAVQLSPETLRSADLAVKEQLLRYLESPPAPSDKGFKENEYHAFLNLPGATNQKDYRTRKMDINTYSPEIQESVANIILLEKLKDTRAFCGFTRLIPWDEHDPPMSLDEHIAQAYGSNDEVLVNEVRGEGIFLEFKQERMSKWTENKEVQREYNRLPEDIREELNEIYDNPIRFILMHSFAHALINELAKLAGYSAMSLCERVYVNKKNDSGMCGVLIYTADSDSEGSLGGLVRQGLPDNLNHIFLNAISSSGWCSSDPVCSDYGTQGPTATNISACHNCLILPETTCEFFNMYLNRRFINTSNYSSTFGFFQS
jgi:hypothetical protein